MATTYTSGASGNMSILGGTVQITDWEATSTYGDVDTTSSKDFDTASNALWHSQLKTAHGLEFKFSGFLDISNTGYNATNTGLIAALKQRNAPAAVVLAYSNTANYASFNGDLLVLDVKMAVNGAVTLTGSGKSNGVVTY